MPMPTGRRGIHRIRLAPSADAADRRETLIVGVKYVSRRPDRSRHDQGAEKAEREFHCFSFRIILSLATFNRQLSSSVAGCKFFTQRFYLAARPEAVWVAANSKPRGRLGSETSEWRPRLVNDFK
jgi:hypothetical protein